LKLEPRENFSMEGDSMKAQKTMQKLGLARNNRGERDGLERRRWVKNSLGALGALGLGALVASGREMAAEAAPPERPWREEPIYIIPGEAGQWLVEPGHRLVTRGKLVTWKAHGFTQKVRLLLPDDVFEPSMVTIDQGQKEGRARVKGTAPSGPHPYDVLCDGRLAIGGSHPGIIVDP